MAAKKGSYGFVSADYIFDTMEKEGYIRYVDDEYKKVGVAFIGGAATDAEAEYMFMIANGMTDGWFELKKKPAYEAEAKAKASKEKGYYEWHPSYDQIKGIFDHYKGFVDNKDAKETLIQSQWGLNQCTKPAILQARKG